MAGVLLPMRRFHSMALIIISPTLFSPGVAAPLQNMVLRGLARENPHGSAGLWRICDQGPPDGSRH